MGLLYLVEELLAQRYGSQGLGWLRADVMSRYALRGLALGSATALAYLALRAVTSRLFRDRDTLRRRANFVGGALLVLFAVPAFDPAFAWEGFKSLAPGRAAASLPRIGVLALCGASSLVAGGMLWWISRFFAGHVTPRLYMLTPLALALLLVPAAPLTRTPAAQDAPDILLVTIDTLRADRTSAYAYGRPTSPELESIAAEGLLFEHAVSPSPWTLPSLATFHSGLYPTEHGAILLTTKLRRRFVTLAEVLKSRGYDTASFVTQAFAGRAYGVGQGFDTISERLVLGGEPTTSARLSDLVGSWLASRSSERPLFLWVHYFDPHADYVGHDGFDFADTTMEQRVPYSRVAPQPATPELAAHVADLYDEEVAFTDRAIGELRRAWEARGSSRRQFTLVTADHGEFFGERGIWGHGKTLYAQVSRVPLLVAGDLPESLRGRRIDAPVEARMLGQTVLDLAGVRGSPFPRARSLTRLAEGSEEFQPAITEHWDHRRELFRRAALFGSWKLIHNVTEGTEELYHFVSDPSESVNVVDASADGTAVLEQLRSELRGRPLPGFLRSDKGLSASEQESLRSLGYLD